MVAAVEADPPLLVVPGPLWLYVNVVAVTPVIVTTPLNELSVTPLIPTIWPVVRPAADATVAVTVVPDRVIELIAYAGGLTLVPLLGMVNVAGKEKTLALSGVRLNVVELFIRIFVPTGDVCLTVKDTAGPLMGEDVFTNCQVDCSISAPTVTGR